jgi:hypothetical protein
MTCPVCNNSLHVSAGCYHEYDGYMVGYYGKNWVYPNQTRVWVGSERYASIIIDTIVSVERINKLILLK